MSTGDSVWVHPLSNPGGAARAYVDLVSSNGKSVALRLEDKPSWFRVMDGVFLHKEDGRIELLLLRDAIDAPWVDTITGKQYEIKETKP